MCRHGMEVQGEPVLKPTKWLTNASETAKEVGAQCQGEHHRRILLGGVAKQCEIYPARLCRAIWKGLRKHIVKTGVIQEGALGAVCQAIETNQEEWSKMF